MRFHAEGTRPSVSDSFIPVRLFGRWLRFREKQRCEYAGMLWTFTIDGEGWVLIH